MKCQSLNHLICFVIFIIYKVFVFKIDLFLNAFFKTVVYDWCQYIYITKNMIFLENDNCQLDLNRFIQAKT